MLLTLRKFLPRLPGMVSNGLNALQSKFLKEILERNIEYSRAGEYGTVPGSLSRNSSKCQLHDEFIVSPGSDISSAKKPK